MLLMYCILENPDIGKKTKVTDKRGFRLVDTSKAFSAPTSKTFDAAKLAKDPFRDVLRLQHPFIGIVPLIKNKKQCP